MKWSFKIGRIARIDVRVHATFFLLVAWVAWRSYAQGGTVHAALTGLLFVGLLFAIVVLHELGHALAARRFGISTRDITLLPIGGVARLEGMPERPRDELVVALAGPAVNVALAAILAAVAVVLGVSVAPGAATDHPLALLVWINVALAVFNMLPAFPMDGGRALRALLAMRLSPVRATEIAARLGQGLALVLGLAGLFGNPLLILIAAFVWLGARGETVAAQIKDALRGVSVGAAAIREFRALGPDDPIGWAVEHALRSLQRDFPVLEAGRIVGLLSHRDLLRGLTELGPDTTVAQAMDPSPTTLPAEADLDRGLGLLQQSPGRCVLIVDAEGSLFGMLTIEAIGELVAIREAVREHLRVRDGLGPAVSRRPLPPSPASGGSIGLTEPTSGVR